MVADISEDEQEEMVVDEESGEEVPKPKRARVTRSKSQVKVLFYFSSYLSRFQRGPCSKARPARGAGEVI